MNKSKPPLERADQFGSLDECRKFLRLSEHEVRELKKLGCLRLPGGKTKPAMLDEDYLAHAHLLKRRSAPDDSGGPHPRRSGASETLSVSPRKGRIAAVAPIAANFESWQAAQGGHTQS